MTLKRRKNNSALGKDGIPYSFLKLLGPPFIYCLTSLINSSWTLGYFPLLFYEARIIVIRKPQKPSYDTPKA